MIFTPIADINFIPIKYPRQPPIVEPAVHVRAYLNEYLGIGRKRAIKRTSGGMGKKEDSINANIKSAKVP